jgi:uronate dehydrogenase
VFSAMLPDTAEFPDKDDVTTLYQGGKFLLDGPIYK